MDAQLQAAAVDPPLPRQSVDVLRRRIDQLQQAARSLLGRKRFMQGRIAESRSQQSVAARPAADESGTEKTGDEAEAHISECPVCLQPIRDDMFLFTVCGHSFCQACATQQVVRGGTCGVCRAKVTAKQVLRVASSLGRHTAAECDPDYELLKEVLFFACHSQL